MKKNTFIITCLLLIQLVMAQSPGGVVGASQWYNNTGASVTQWTDSSGNNNNVPVATTPSFTNSINFNTVSTFNGSSYYRRTTVGTNFPTSTSGATYFYVAKTNSSATNEREVLGRGGYFYNDGFNSGQFNATNLYAGSYYGGFSQDANITNAWSLGNSKLVRSGYSNGINNNRYISQNGSIETVAATASSISFASDNFSIGATYNGDRQWIGDIAEIIVYPLKLNSTDNNKVESYLAIKYGITKEGNYVASNGTVVYNDATYNKNIIALARDDNSLLHQRITASQDVINDVLTVSTNNNLSSLNSGANQTNITNDNSFMFFANNGATLELLGSSLPSGYYKRVLRQWKVTKSASFTQSTFLKFNGFSSNSDITWYLVKRNGNADLSTSITQVVALNGVGVTATAVNLEDGDYFTLMSTVVDSDGDSEPDLADFDDDNDGVLDDFECTSYTRYWSGIPIITGANSARGVAGGVGYTYNSSSPVQTEGAIQNFGSFPTEYGLVNQTNIMNTAANMNTITFDQPVVNPVFMIASIGSAGQFVTVDFQYPISIQWSQNVSQNSATQIVGNEGNVILTIPGIYSSVTFSYNTAEFRANFVFGFSVRDLCDTDSDGVANIIDLDSDNDGCPDYIEGSGSYTTSNGVTAGGTLTDGNGNAITQNLGNIVNAQGIPTVAGSGQTAGTSQNVNAVGCYAPGGVFSDFIVWYKADASVYSNAGTTLATNGNTVQQWDDHSGSGYNLSQATSGDRPVFYNSTANKLVNFNPSIEYVSTDRLVNVNRLMPISSAHSFFGVAIDQAAATGYKAVFTADDSDGNFELYKGYTSGNGVNGWMAYKIGDYRLVNGLNNNNVIGGNGFSPSGGSNGAWNGTAYVENLGIQPQIFGLLGNGTAAGSGVSFIDGYKATNTSSAGNPANWFGRFSVGARTGGGNPFTGRIPEIIAFNRQLTDTEAQKINSYLAIKYGTTLGQGGVNIVNNNGNNYNYLASDNSIIWNATANSTYKFHIAGIGRDDASALNQKQSQSQNTGNHVIFGLGTVAATNAANANTFTADKQFLLWGDNGASGPVAFSDTSDSSIFSRLARTWFVDNSNSYAQDTQLLIPVALTTGGSSPKLILNANNTFASGTNTYIPLSTTTTINSVSYYVVNLTAAQVANDFYFTIATNQKAPGGVATDLRFWLNMSAFTPSQWTDLSGNSNHFLSTNVNKQPPIEVAKERANFHASVDFRQSSWGGTQDLMHKPAPGPFTSNNLDATIFASLSRESDTGYRDVIGFGGGANTSTPLTFNVGADSPVWTAEPSGNHTMSLYPWRGPEFVTTTPTNGTLNQVLTTSKTHIPDVTWRYNQSNGVDYALDGYQVTAAINPGTISGASGAVIDGQAEINDGRISELIGYERSLSTLEKQKIRSYLALKYGVSQNQYVATNYLNSNGAIVWDATTNSGFKSDIAGIGKDDFGALNQVMSKSINNVAEPLLSLTAIPSSASNATQAGLVNFDNNNQYLIWGNNATRGFTPFTNVIDSNINVRLSRVWKAQTSNYNLTGNDDIVFNFPEASVKPFINSGATVYLVLSTTPDFSSGNYLFPIPTTTTTIDSRTYVSTIYDVSSNLFSGIVSNGTFYFTVAGKGQGPGGVLGIFWNRADKDLVTSGTTITKWTDQMYGIESTQVADNTNRPVIGTDATLFNFNPYVNFTNQNQTLGNESVAPAEGFTAHIEQFFVTRDNAYSGRFFGLNYDLRGSAGGAAFHDWNAFESNFYRSRANSPGGGTTTTNFAPTLSTTFTNLSHLISNATASTFGYRGFGSAVANTTNANYNYIGQGGFLYGSNAEGTGLIGDDAGVTAQIAEHLIVGEALTATERRQVESYLAVKYGITISDLTSDASYRDASGNATFTVDATFRHDIFGIAKEAAAGIDQRISRSINNDAGNATNIITVSTDTNFTNLNATHADALSDAQYLIFASNNGAVAFSGGSAITAADGTVFSNTEVLATRWKVQDKGAVGCVNMRFNNAAFTAVTGSTKYYMIVADDAAFTQNVTYKEVPRDASSNIDVTVNFGDNTNGSATTGNYFTIARKSLSITAANLATVQTGINTIPSLSTWKPTLPNVYLEINSNNKGVVLPHVAGTGAITSPIAGMIIYDTTDSAIKVYTGSSWRKLGETGSSSSFCN
jgi:hypothetical protein